MMMMMTLASTQISCLQFELDDRVNDSEMGNDMFNK